MVDRSWAQTLGSYSASAHCSPSLRCQLLNLPAVTLRTPKNCALMHASETVGYNPKNYRSWTLDMFKKEDGPMGQISQIARIHGSWSIQIWYVFCETTRNHWGIPLCCPNGFAPQVAKVWWFLDEMTEMISISWVFLSDFFVKSMDRAIPQQDDGGPRSTGYTTRPCCIKPMGWSLPSPWLLTQWPIICIRRNHSKLWK